MLQNTYGASLIRRSLAAGYLLAHLFRNMNDAGLGGFVRDFGDAADARSLLASACFLTFAAAQLPLGALLAVFGPRRVQFTLALCAAAGAGLTLPLALQAASLMWFGWPRPSLVPQ